MGTKTKATQSTNSQAHESSPSGNRPMGQLNENQVIEEVPGTTVPIVEEVPGTPATPAPAGSAIEFTEAEKHRPVCSPASQASRRRESVGVSATPDPIVDASFANIASLQDERTFWKAIARAIGPQIMTTVKSTGTRPLAGDISKLSHRKLANKLRVEGYSESAIQQLEATQTESGAEASTDQMEFWGIIASAVVPMLMPVAQQLAGKAVHAGASWAKSLFESSPQEASAETEAMSRQLEAMLIQQAAVNQTESGDAGSAADQREFWGAIARKLVPALAPVAKKVAGAAVDAGTSWVKTLFESSPQDSGAKMQAMSRQLEAMFLLQAASSPQEGDTESSADQREFWGAIAGALVPALAPLAKAAAGAAVQAGTSWARKFFESSPQEGDTEASADQLEFWGAIAGALVPVLTPVAKKLAVTAVHAGGSLVTSSIRKIFESSPRESGAETEAISQQLEAMLIQQAAVNQTESGDAGSADQREFWGAIVRTLAPALAPLAQQVAGAAVHAGTNLVTGGINQLGSTLTHMLRREGYSESAIQQLAASRAESGADGSAADQREFLSVIVRTLAPVLKPVAQQVAGAAVSAGGSLVRSGLKRIFESGQQEAGRAAFVQELETLEVIIGEDERVQVTNTTHNPYRRICHLSITAADGSAFLGTGFFIGPRTILTAGHCVYDRDHGGWPQQIIVSPGRNGSNQPFGQFIATNFCSVEGWTRNQDRDCDYGVIQLDKNANVPAVGSFGFGMFPAQALLNKTLRTAGYPGDKRGDQYGTMWFGSKIIKAVTPTTIVYDIDTVGGQSGSPVYDESNRVVGIHTNGNLEGNSATRITQAVFNNLLRWRSQGGAS